MNRQGPVNASEVASSVSLHKKVSLDDNQKLPPRYCTNLIWQYFDYNMSPIKMSRLLEILDTFVRGSFVPSYLRS